MNLNVDQIGYYKHHIVAKHLTCGPHLVHYYFDPSSFKQLGEDKNALISINNDVVTVSDDGCVIIHMPYPNNDRNAVIHVLDNDLVIVHVPDSNSDK